MIKSDVEILEANRYHKNIQWPSMKLIALIICTRKNQFHIYPTMKKHDCYWCKNGY